MIKRLFITLLLASSLSAQDLRVAGIFSNNAVLQCDTALPVWGTAKPGTGVQVSFAGQTKTDTACRLGRWYVSFDPMEASTDPRKLVISAEDSTVIVNNLLVGEVWLASGQSNMDMNLQGCAKQNEHFKNVVANPAPTLLRMLKIRSPDTAQPITDLATKWTEDTPATRASFSAAAYVFAQRLAEELKVPIGIIDTSWGGKPIEGFIPRKAFDSHPTLQTILQLADAEKFDALKELEGGVIIRNTAGRPGRIFNGRMAPIVPYALRGFIWYQGESNAGTGEDPRDYRFKQQALIEGWRQAWDRPDTPFYCVQLPAFKDESAGWVRLREEQRLALSVPHTGMAVAIDLRDTNIHPGNKLDVGERLARWPLAQVYGQAIEVSGPLFEKAVIQEDAIQVHFSHVAGGLITASKAGLDAPVTTPDVPPGSFELADASGTWHPAKAIIEADSKTVRVTSTMVKQPTAVRYATEGDPEKANLYNRQKLPASPFCSELSLLPWQK
ncbi:MAG: sialate O-acetylesterase [Kiritimatiellia bacterium]|jgi:sialate O-acetylesterase